LLIVSIITARISDMVLDSRVGALDRTLGFLFGLGRARLDYRRRGLPVFRLAGPRPQSAGMGAWSKVEAGAAKHGTMADVDVAG